jgi:thiol-disulfide isomerase/thioredoxin
MRFLLFLCLPLLALTEAQANHGLTEPSDGTVASFIEVDPPRKLDPVAFFREGVQPMDLSAFRGKVVLLNLWATWCSPCLRELPALDRLQQRLGGDDFVVLPIAIDRQGIQAVSAYYEKLEIKHLGRYIGTAEEMGKAFPIDVFPASFFIDREGRVLSFMRSFVDWDAPEADQLIQSYMAH